MLINHQLNKESKKVHFIHIVSFKYFAFVSWSLYVIICSMYYYDMKTTSKTTKSHMKKIIQNTNWTEHFILSYPSPPVAMAGASQPWYMPATWPLGHVSAAITKDKDEKPNKPSATPYLDLSGNLTAFAAAARSWCLAYLCIFYLPGKKSILKI